MSESLSKSNTESENKGLSVLLFYYNDTVGTCIKSNPYLHATAVSCPINWLLKQSFAIGKLAHW